MYTIAVIVRRALVILFRLVFSFVVMRVVFSLSDSEDSRELNFIKKFLYVVTEPFLSPVREIQNKLFGRFALQLDFSYLVVIAVLSVLLIVF